jgi:hypothetical protein
VYNDVLVRMKCILLLALFLGSCATIATKSKFPSSRPTNSIKQVALSITGSSEQMPEKRRADSLFAQELASQLAAVTGWQVRYVGKKNELSKAYPSPEIFLQKNSQYQAIIQSGISIVSYGTKRGQPRYEAWVQMGMWQATESPFLGQSQFNTLVGTSYGFHPNLENAVKNSVAGLVLPWKKQYGNRY